MLHEYSITLSFFCAHSYLLKIDLEQEICTQGQWRMTKPVLHRYTTRLGILTIQKLYLKSSSSE